MLNKNVASLLNEQITKEFYSAYSYLHFANYYESKGLLGFASWFKIQSKEELDHGMLIYQYLQDNGETVIFGNITTPEINFENFMVPHIFVLLIRYLKDTNHLNLSRKSPFLKLGFGQRFLLLPVLL